MEELLWIVETKNYYPTCCWLNEIQKIINNIRKITLSYGTIDTVIDYIESQDINLEKILSENDISEEKIKIYRNYPNNINLKLFIDKITDISSKLIEEFKY